MSTFPNIAGGDREGLASPGKNKPLIMGAVALLLTLASWLARATWPHTASASGEGTGEKSRIQ